MLEWLSQFAPVTTQYGWETANLRHHLGLHKTRNKSEQSPQSHAVDGVTLAASQFVNYQPFHTANTHGHEWVGSVEITPAIFVVIRRPPISRRQLHLMVFAKGGVRRKYGGSTTRHGLRKGDYVKAEQAGRISHGWVSGDTERQVSVSNISWKRLGQFTAKKVQLVKRATGLIVTGVKTPVSVSSAT